ncbi:conserved exported hypothetical protein [Paraburkholderia piptadeniae]|uniref:Heme-binding protein n=2 Tax=Paraburkholderia TaxID=1822464 RepID=A0A7X1NEH7_9BURK|nr:MULTISPECIES: heme-binding protein [Paraburkholderia]MPW20440.1 heme-binding protein [Paraburkholderia franconis]SIT50912.1 conserved exported hypothetical protein [Paraburkholderia piptadeniae]
MSKTKNAITLGAIAVAGLSSLSAAYAQVSTSGYVLPMNLAFEAALEAVQTCNAKGYAVTATVVDVAGTPQAVLRSDHAAVHTRDSSYRKAYTAVSMGSVFHFDRTSQFLDLLTSKFPPLAAQSLASTPNVTTLPGGVAIKVGDEIIAGIGVGGSPGGDKDEACALAAVAKIKDKLPH